MITVVMVTVMSAMVMVITILDIDCTEVNTGHQTDTQCVTIDNAQFLETH